MNEVGNGSKSIIVCQSSLVMLKYIQWELFVFSHFDSSSKNLLNYGFFQNAERKSRAKKKNLNRYLV